MFGLREVDVTRCKSEFGIGFMLEIYNPKVYRVARSLCGLLSRVANVELSPRGGDYIGVWPVCPFCEVRQFMLASQFNEEAVTCKRCGSGFRIRGVEWPYTMVRGAE